MSFYVLNEPIQDRKQWSMLDPEPRFFTNHNLGALQKEVRDFLSRASIHVLAISPALPGTNGDSGGNVWTVWTVTVIYQERVDPNSGNGGDQ